MKKKFTFLALIVFCCFGLNAFANWDQYKDSTLSRLPSIPGWCTTEKAGRMMDLILQTNPKICVEIGVFGGASIYPTAMALKYQGCNGVVFAIDPWDNVECIKGYDPNDPNFQWWNAVDLKKIYNDFVTMLYINGISNYCKVMKTVSSVALPQFADESIDIIHIDGNHTEDSAFYDVQNFVPKVKKGGYIWFDDANWTTTHKAVKFLMEHCELDKSSSASDAYLLFIKT